jgi:hypothetical protein
MTCQCVGSDRVEAINSTTLEVLFHLGPYHTMDIGIYPFPLKERIFKSDTQDIVAVIGGAEKLYVAKAGLRSYCRLERARKHLLRGSSFFQPSS